VSQLSGVSAEVPRSSPVSGPAAAALVFEWLGRPFLREATLVSFAFDPYVAWSEPRGTSQRLINMLVRASSTADITVVVSSTAVDPQSGRGSRGRRELLGLCAAGAAVFSHELLHAKIYLFAEEGRCCWIVGSSNLTGGGLGKNTEVNLRGFHAEDYAVVRASVVALVSASEPVDEVVQRD